MSRIVANRVGVFSGKVSAMPLRLNDVTFCKRCEHWVKMTVSGLCACGAIITATPAVAATMTPAAMSAQHLSYQAWSPGDSEPFHPAEADPTLDGESFMIMSTIPTSQLVIDPYGQWKPSRRQYNGGAVPTI
jgi:hypothetical protein